jgi:hypothetical protein
MPSWGDERACSVVQLSVVKRRFSSLDVRPRIHLVVAGLLAFALAAGEEALIPSRRYDTDNIISAVVLVALVLLFLFLAWRSERKRSRSSNRSD